MENKEKTFAARLVNNLSEFNSQVDIVIPYHGQYDKVANLLESIFRLTRSNYYKVYVVDDCSNNSSFIETIEKNTTKNANKLKQEKILFAIRNNEQKGFAGACKVGYEAGESPYVCFLNSDCLIKDSAWLRTMGETLIRLHSQNVKMVSATTNNPVNGDIAQLGDQFNRNIQDVIINDDSYLSLFCFMCHRQLFSHIGGFLKEYPYYGYEDEEIAARLKKNGYKQAVSRASWVYHEGQATIIPFLRKNPNLKELIDGNRKLCINDMKKLM